jgi:hypothetical protein
MKGLIRVLPLWVAFIGFFTFSIAYSQESPRPYTIVDTGLDHCYGFGGPIECPSPGERFFGQDAQYMGNQPNYRDNNDGAVTDLNTGLQWQKTPDFVRRSWKEAANYAQSLELAGHMDWRLPTIKELFSLAIFRGNIRTKTPYIETRYFDFKYPDTSKGFRIIDAQYWSANIYAGLAMQNRLSAFGFNFADGRIKAYPVNDPRGRRGRSRPGRFVRCVRGPAYGVNDFKDNGDGTVTDHATGLTWMKKDSPRPMNWADALSYAEGMRYGGYDDWRLPNVKELQSIVDYNRAPDARAGFIKGPAIDPIFDLSDDEGWHWSSSTFIASGGALYVAFGRAMSAWKFQGELMNAHGAGAVRSDPKQGDPGAWPRGRGPQGDQIRILNYVRCVRGGAAELRIKPGPGDITDPRPTKPLPAPRMSGRQQGGFIGRLDLDGDGKVSPLEFDGPSHGFNHFDKNRDGFITSQEAPHGPRPSMGPMQRRPRPGRGQPH